jgi:hypothetical protein
MAETTTTARCKVCQTRATVRYAQSREYGKLRVELEHMDDDLHNIVPYAEDGRRGHSAILLDPAVEQLIEFREE